MALSSLLARYLSFQAGSRLIDGGELSQFASSLQTATSGYTAYAGGGQTNATQLKLGFNIVETVASSSDSVKLPLAVPGSVCVVYNASATTLAVFGQASNPNSATNAGDTIAALADNTQQATATGVTQATATCVTYTCFKAGQWKQGPLT